MIKYYYYNILLVYFMVQMLLGTCSKKTSKIDRSVYYTKKYQILHLEN